MAFKFGSVLLYDTMLPWFSDEPPTPKKTLAPMPPVKSILWWGLGSYLLLSGFEQIPPQVALQTSWQHLFIVSAQWPLTRPVLNSWISVWSYHPIMYNIVVFMIEAVLGIFLLTEHNTLLGRITLIATGLWGLLIGVFAQGLGFLFSGINSWVAAAPGSGLLVAWLAALLLLAPHRRWEQPTHLRWTSAAILAVGCLWQLSFFGRRTIWYPPHPKVPEPHWLYGPIDWMAHASLSEPLVVNLFWFLLLAYLAVSFFLPSWHRPISLALLLIVWWFGENFGLTPAFGLSLNVAPLWALIVVAIPSQKGRAPI